MDVNYIVLLFVAIVLGLAYGLIGYFADRVKNGGELDIPKLIATIVYSIIVGVIAVQTGAIDLTKIADWQTIFSPVWTMYLGIYLGILYVVQKILGTFVSAATTRVTVYKTILAQALGEYRIMSDSVFGFLTYDMDSSQKANTEAAVKDMESKKVWQYALLVANNLYIIYQGQIAGHKKYLFYGRFYARGVFSYKPISPDTLERMQKTGKIPDYADLT